MTGSVLAIAQLTVREAFRKRVFVNLAVFAALMVGVSLLMTGLTIGQHQRVIHTVSFTVLAVVGNLLAVFLGAGLIAHEVERRTLYTIVSRPIRRYVFVLGRYLGLAVVLAINTIVGGMLVKVVLMVSNWPAFDHFVVSLGLIYVEMLVVLSISVVFSSFSTPTLSATFGFCFWVIGRLSVELQELAALAKNDGLAAAMKASYTVLPNLGRLDPMNLLIHSQPPDGGHVAMLFAYGLLYVAVMLTIACWTFERRDLK
ncbi:MAG: ABC transporter permease [Myxococcota bacterium]|nr:ABC transporter permease [Myxococcota bacterium]